MAFKILNASKYTKELKVRIQKTGRLGFSGPAQEALHLNPETQIMLAYDDEASADCRLAMVKLSSGAKEESFPCVQSSGYYYLNTANLFNSLGYDYAHESIYFTLKRTSELDQELGGEVYLMQQRKSKGRSNTSKTKAEEEEDLPFDFQ